LGRLVIWSLGHLTNKHNIPTFEIADPPGCHRITTSSSQNVHIPVITT
jgi:hypothetical protein